jgi:CRP-like cAMP-binding protein
VHFGRELQRSPALLSTMHRYLYVTLEQLATASACRRFHALGPRLARWLLMSHDRAHADQFQVTHEFLGLMLGVRRVGVTVAAGGLQAHGLIHYHRGTVQVRDRIGLEAQACSCYAADRAVYKLRMQG